MLNPLGSDQGTPLIFNLSDSAISLQKGKKTLYLTPFSRSMISRDGILLFQSREFPKIRPNRWGYPDQVVFGKTKDFILGLEISEGVREFGDVLHEFDRWIDSLAGYNGPVGWKGWVTATIAPVFLWDQIQSARLAMSLASHMRNAALEVAPRGEEVLMRAMAFSADGKIQSRTVTVRIRPDGEKKSDLIFETSPPGYSFFRFTTEIYQVRVEATPSFSETELIEWHKDFSAELDGFEFQFH